MVGMNGVNIALGYGLASYMGLAFYYVDNPTAQWRAPLGIALIWPLMMVLVCLIIPESPRYLLMHGRIEEAREVVYKLHSIKGDPDQEFARGEFYQMSKQAELDRTMEPGWVSCFTLIPHLGKAGTDEYGCLTISWKAPRTPTVPRCSDVHHNSLMLGSKSGKSTCLL